MSLGVNGVVRLGTDPEAKQFGDKQVVKFRAAVQDSKEKTSWYTVAAFGKTGDFALEYLKKGRVIELRGSIQENKWTDKDGQERTTYEVTADRFQFVPSDPKPESKEQPY